MNMSEPEQFMAELRRLVDALAQPKKLDETLWSTEQIAKWFGLSKSTVELRVVTRQDFPPGVRPVDTAQAQRRWFASDVVEWARRNRGHLPTPRKGRPRKAA